jgi:hypothetical protein
LVPVVLHSPHPKSKGYEYLFSRYIITRFVFCTTSAVNQRQDGPPGKNQDKECGSVESGNHWISYMVVNIITLYTVNRARYPIYNKFW